ncbi:PQQ-binding-like beta-propeller repeat protein [Paenibacillus tepidiphilus]|uniref:PQQ-binding-like beta-propeller repeat protein n=1 Tax=Paenibacillus tepidiphilus TaxID=2608683 RepID=UPI0013A55502|nr:PQQ-binding-like beta-propeller repeat protein [Paenibacillus tepidiphilus]
MASPTTALKLLLASALLIPSAIGLQPGSSLALAEPEIHTAAVNPNQQATLPLLWQANTDGAGLYYEQRPVHNGTVFYVKHNKLYAREAASGTINWSYAKGAFPEIVTNNSVLFVTGGGDLVKLDAKTGKEIWKVKAAARPLELGGRIKLLDGTVYFANESGGMAAFDAVTGKRLWENKAVPMYAGSIYRKYGGVLVVSSTVNNIRSQFFGLNASTGKVLWRTEGMYSFVGSQNGQVIIRESAEPSATLTKIPGYLLTLAVLDPATGKITKPENYQPLPDVSRMAARYTSLQGPYAYTADGLLEENNVYLTRFARGQFNADTAHSYKRFGNWLAGPIQGIAYFQQGTEITAVNLANNSSVRFGDSGSKAVTLQRIGKAVFIGDENGMLSIMDAATGTTLGRIATGISSYGTITVTNGTVLIPSETKLMAVKLPEKLL